MSASLELIKFNIRRRLKLRLDVFLIKLILRITEYLIAILLLPLTFLFHLLGYRYVNFFVERIGHLALEPDCLLKEQALGKIKTRKWILLAPKNKVANEHLLAYWKEYYVIVTNRFLCLIIKSMSHLGLMFFNIDRYCRVFDRPQDAFKIYSMWGDRPPILKLSHEDSLFGDQIMDHMGMPAGAWFVCIHAREAGFSVIDDEIQSFRNADISNYDLAIEEIIKRGGWVIRIGDPNGQKLLPRNYVIDYAHSSFKSARMDMYLCAKAKFILGSTSGICVLAAVFNTPCAIANMVPIADLWYNAGDISISKRIKSKQTGEYLSFNDAFSFPIGIYKYSGQFDKANLLVIENSKEQILALIHEMFLPETERKLVIQKTKRFLIDCCNFDERFPAFYSQASVSSYNIYFFE